MSRAHILHKVRTAICRSAGQAPSEPPPPLLRIPKIDLERRIEMFCQALEKLSGTPFVAASPEQGLSHVAGLIAGKQAVASNAPFLRDACATADIGVTSADYALADTGSLVMLSSHSEARLVSLLPPVHLAVVPRRKLLTGLDELLTVLPNPAAQTSSMVLITGPSRTADIEQILVRGVHGPRAIHVVLI